MQGLALCTMYVINGPHLPRAGSSHKYHRSSRVSFFHFRLGWVESRQEKSSGCFGIFKKCLNIVKMAASRHVLAKWPECHNLVSYQTKMAHYTPNFLRKSQKSPIFDQKCSHLVTLRSGITEIQFQPELPDLYIFRQKIGDFGIFSKKFVNYPVSTKTSGNVAL